MNISPLTHLSLDSEENQTSSWEFYPWNKELFILITANTQIDVFWRVKFLFQKNPYFSLVSNNLWLSVSVFLIDIVFYLITLSNVKRKENLSLNTGKWKLLQSPSKSSSLISGLLMVKVNFKNTCLLKSRFKRGMEIMSVEACNS